MEERFQSFISSPVRRLTAADSGLGQVLLRFSRSWQDCVYVRGRLHHGLAHPLTRNYYLTRSERTLPGRVRPAMLDEGEITL